MSITTVTLLSSLWVPFYFGILFSGLFRVLNSIFGSLIGSFLDISVSVFNSIHPFNILYVKLLLIFNLFITIFNLNYCFSCEGIIILHELFFDPSITLRNDQFQVLHHQLEEDHIPMPLHNLYLLR